MRSKKRRALTAEEQWVLETVGRAGAPIPYWKLCAPWARDRGTSGNVVTWPRRVVSSALNELEKREMLVIQPPHKQGGAALMDAKEPRYNETENYASKGGGGK